MMRKYGIYESLVWCLRVLSMVFMSRKYGTYECHYNRCCLLGFILNDKLYYKRSEKISKSCMKQK